jgi:hypothetical protein
MLISLLSSDNTLSRYLCRDCEENGISIQIQESIQSDNILIIRVDRYYNHLVQDPDCCPDCLIIQRCSPNTFYIYIVELRNIASPSGFKISLIVEKFITCLDDFMSQRFGNYFHNEMFRILGIKLIFITDPYGFRKHPEKQLLMRGHKLDALMSQRVPQYFNKHLYIEHRLPNPTIKNCNQIQ